MTFTFANADYFSIYPRLRYLIPALSTTIKVFCHSSSNEDLLHFNKSHRKQSNQGRLKVLIDVWLTEVL